MKEVRIFQHNRAAMENNLCSHCRKKLSQNKTYCKCCGNTHGAFEPKEIKQNTLCYIHPDKKAEYYCNTCNRFICETCKSDRDGFIFSGGFSTHMCKECKQQIEQAEEGFRGFICPNHNIDELIKAEVKCESPNDCSVYICKKCASEYEVDGKYYCPQCWIGWWKELPWYKKIFQKGDYPKIY